MNNNQSNGQKGPASQGPRPASNGPASQNNPFSMGNPIDIQQVFHVLAIIRERWLWGLATGLLAAGIFIFVSLREEPVYAADAFLLVEAKAEQVIDVEKVIDTSLTGMVEMELENHLRKMRSRKFIQSVIQSFGQREVDLITRPYRMEDPVPSLAQIVVGAVRTSRQDQLFTIRALHRDPQAAALIANRYMAHYITSTLDRSWTGNESARTFLERQAEELRDKVAAAEQQLTAYRTEHNLVSLEENQNIIVARLTSMNEQRTATRMEQLQLEAAVEQVEAARETGADLTEIPFIASYGAIGEVLARKKALEAELSALGLRYLERHPDMVEATERLGLVEQQLATEVARAVRDLANSKESVDRRMERLDTEMQAAEDAALALDRQAVEYNVLRRQLESDRRTFDTIIARLNETNLASNLDTTNLRILDEAVPPGAPVEPNPPKIFMIGAFLFGIGLIGIPLLIEAVDNRLKSAYDVETFIGKPLLADLPFIKQLETQEMAPTTVLNESEDMLAEGFRAAYSSLQLHSHADMPKTILVTSTRPSEGKTFVASNLVACMAKHGLRCLLVDTDFRRPTLHRHFELRNDKGIIPWIEAVQSGKADPGALFQEPSARSPEGKAGDGFLEIRRIAEGFDFLRAGGSTKKTTEMIDSAAFEQLMHAMRGHYDVILLDTPPVSVFTDSFFLGEFADEIIYVARFNQVSRQKARHFIHKLDAHQHKVVGMIINGRTSAKGQRYGYDYNYSYYSSDYKYYKKYTRETNKEEQQPKPRSRRSVSS